MREDGGVATAIGINKNPPVWMLLVGVTKQHKNIQNHSKTIHGSLKYSKDTEETLKNSVNKTSEEGVLIH